jgi:hypothetical protein
MSKVSGYVIAKGGQLYGPYTDITEAAHMAAHFAKTDGEVLISIRLLVEPPPIPRHLRKEPADYKPVTLEIEPNGNVRQT